MGFSYFFRPLTRFLKMAFLGVAYFKPMPISARECPNFLKNWESTNFDMGFQKKNISSRSEKVDFLKNDVFSRTRT